MKVYLIAGTLDVIILIRVNGTKRKWLVIDIKTSNRGSYYKIKTADDVEENYVSQLKIYMRAAKEDGYDIVPYGIIFFVCKDNSETKEFYFDYKDNDVNEELALAKRGKNFLEGKAMPEILRECKNRTTSRYRYCEFSSICFRCKSCTSLLSFTTKKKFGELTK